MVQGAWASLLSPGLVKALKESEKYYVLSEADYLKLLNRSRAAVRELHVYDLGDGFLVPCELVDDLFE